MLSRKLLGAGGVSRDLELVFQDAQFNNTDNSFTRGISFADVRKDDLIILSIATRKNSDITYSATNFTKLTDLYVNSTDDTNFAMFSKVADGTETGIDVTTNEVQNNLTIVAIYTKRRYFKPNLDDHYCKQTTANRCYFSNIT